MIQTLTKEINGSNYSVTQFTARRALRLQAKLIKSLGPFLFELSEDKCHAMQILSQTISEDTLEGIVIDLLASTRKSGVELTPSTIDMEFAGDIGTLYEVSKYVLEVNFQNFWEALGIGKKDDAIREPENKQKIVFPKR